MPKALQVHGAQIQGQRRRQEDAFDVHRYAAREVLMVAADGLGGHPAGDVASKEGMAEFVRHFTACRKHGEGTPRAWMEEAVHAAQRHLLKQQRTYTERLGMATTLVALYVKGRTVWAASVGDSYVLLLRDGALQRLNELHGEGGGVTSAIGFNLTRIDLSDGIKVHHGDRFLLATDGIVTLGEDELTRILAASKAPEEAATSLLAAVERHGHAYQDNTTLIAVFL